MKKKRARPVGGGVRVHNIKPASRRIKGVGAGSIGLWERGRFLKKLCQQP